MRRRDPVPPVHLAFRELTYRPIYRRKNEEKKTFEMAKRKKERKKKRGKKKKKTKKPRTIHKSRQKLRQVCVHKHLFSSDDSVYRKILSILNIKNVHFIFYQNRGTQNPQKSAFQYDNLFLGLRLERIFSTGRRLTGCHIL
jgi:hypothetical protein